MRQVPGQVLSKQTVDEEERADGWQRNAHDAACGLEYQHDQYQTDQHIALSNLAGALDQLALKDPLVGRCSHTRQAEHPGQRLPGAAPTAGGVTQVHHQQKEAHMNRAQDLCGNQREGRGGNLENRERQGNGEKAGGPALGFDVQAVGSVAHAGAPAVAGPAEGPVTASGKQTFFLVEALGTGVQGNRQVFRRVFQSDVLGCGVGGDQARQVIEQ
ncbi:hypothetical protein FQZ97_578300 [compost metagenome]